MNVLEGNSIILIFRYFPKTSIFLDIYTLSRLSRNEKCSHKTYFVRSSHIYIIYVCVFVCIYLNRICRICLLWCAAIVLNWHYVRSEYDYFRLADNYAHPVVRKLNMMLKNRLVIKLDASQRWKLFFYSLWREKTIFQLVSEPMYYILYSFLQINYDISPVA